MDRFNELYSTALKFTTQPTNLVDRAYETAMRSGAIEAGHGKYFAPLARVAGRKGFPLFWRDRAKLSAKFNAAAITVYKDPNISTPYHPETAEKNIDHIILGKGHSTVMTLRVLAHELAHVCTVDGPPQLLWEHEGIRISRAKAEVVAEAGAMLVLSGIGYDTLQASAAYIVNCHGTQFMPELRPLIDRVAEEIIELGELHV